MTDRPIIFSATMVRALLAGRKTQTRRLATSPLRRCEPGDRLYVREGHALVPATAYRCSVGVQQLANPGDPHEACVYAAEWERSKPRWRSPLHMPRWASRLTLIVEAVRVEHLREISTADVLAEGAPLDPHHRDCTQDGSNPVMCVGDRPWTTQSPHAWYHRLWDTLHTKPGERWEDNPMVVALTFRVEQRNIDSIEGKGA